MAKIQNNFRWKKEQRKNKKKLKDRIRLVCVRIWRNCRKLKKQRLPNLNFSQKSASTSRNTYVILNSDENNENCEVYKYNKANMLSTVATVYRTQVSSPLLKSRANKINVNHTSCTTEISMKTNKESVQNPKA